MSKEQIEVYRNQAEVLSDLATEMANEIRNVGRRIGGATQINARYFVIKRLACKLKSLYEASDMDLGVGGFLLAVNCYIGEFENKAIGRPVIR